ncbi:MAG: 50S ribosomal protein L29 [bacterium]|nr:50S ribosomal protein L29 [bacterium]
MKAADLHKKEIDELKNTLHTLEEELFTMKFKRRTQNLANPLKIRIIRRDIARTLTIIHEKETRRNSSK